MTCELNWLDDIYSVKAVGESPFGTVDYLPVILELTQSDLCATAGRNDNMSLILKLQIFTIMTVCDIYNYHVSW